MSNTPPVAERKPLTTTHHGNTLVDDYAWLRADNWQEAMREPGKLPEPIANHLRAENAYQEAALADTADQRAALVEEMKGRIKEDDSSVPQADGPYKYWVEYRTGGEYPVYKRRPRDAEAGVDEHVLLDGDLEGKDKDYFSLGGMDRSPSHKLGAWIVDENGSEYYRLRVRDLETATDTGETLEDIGSFAFTDDQTIYYARVDENHRPSKIYRHTLGTDQADDTLIYEEIDPRFFCGVVVSQSERFLMISASVNDMDELHFLDLKTPGAELTCIQPREDGVEYDADHIVIPSENKGGEDHFIIRTNADDAQDFKLVTAPVASPGRANWTDLVPHKPGRTILNAEPLADWLVRMERENALPRIVVRELATGEEHEIAFEEEAYGLGLDVGDEWQSDLIRFSYSSPTTPSQTWEYNLKTRERKLLKEQEVPSGHDASKYVTRRLMVPSHDGELVPATVLHRADLALDGSAPCFLYAYGSYGASMPSGFSTVKFSLVDRGWVQVTAHIRGGAEKGRGWYEQSKKGGKHHTFKDFIAVGEYLAKEGFTARGKIVANGGSAGGMLMGAVANMAPSLFAGIVADVPFVDVLNTMLDADLPLTPGEWSQWGNPIESADEFAIIASYSPYDNVTAQAYPPMLVTAGVSDPRVTYWEPAKWVAKLRATKTDDNPLYLKTNMTSGHFGKTGRFAGLDDTALTYDFAMRSVDQGAGE
ncbi:MAG: S9 family peptidase [Pseudomonadota bacterium]